MTESESGNRIETWHLAATSFVALFLAVAIARYSTARWFRLPITDDMSTLTVGAATIAVLCLHFSLVFSSWAIYSWVAPWFRQVVG